MKKLIIAVATMLATYAALGQGQFAFNNRVLPDINARFVLDSDTGTISSVGTDGPYQVQLFSGSTPLDPASTTFRGAAGSAAAGYVTPTTETVSFPPLSSLHSFPATRFPPLISHHSPCASSAP